MNHLAAESASNVVGAFLQAAHQCVSDAKQEFEVTTDEDEDGAVEGLIRLKLEAEVDELSCAFECGHDARFFGRVDLIGDQDSVGESSDLFFDAWGEPVGEQARADSVFDRLLKKELLRVTCDGRGGGWLGGRRTLTPFLFDQAKVDRVIDHLAFEVSREAGFAQSELTIPMGIGLCTALGHGDDQPHQPGEILQIDVIEPE
jgi:hypothetical protein